VAREGPCLCGGVVEDWLGCGEGEAERGDAHRGVLGELARERADGGLRHQPQVVAGLDTGQEATRTVVYWASLHVSAQTEDCVTSHRSLLASTLDRRRRAPWCIGRACT
jgi:hypothetical protein